MIANYLEDVMDIELVCIDANGNLHVVKPDGYYTGFGYFINLESKGYIDCLGEL